jgi:peptidoglycan/LPS O-acetylase OafA/YrhL
MSQHLVPETSKPGRAHALDGLRGFAAVAVVFYHAILHNDSSLEQRVLLPAWQDMTSTRDAITKLAIIVSHGGVAVLLFFVLSGCVLAMALKRRSDEPATTLGIDFAISRIARLYPAIVVCMLAFFALSQLGLKRIPPFTWQQLVGNTLLTSIQMHGPSGTLQAEMIAVPIIFAVFLLRRRFGAFVYVFALAYAGLAIEAPALVFHLPSMHVYLLAFVVGMAVSEPALRPLLTGVSGTIWWAVLALVVFGRAFHPQGTIGSLVVLILAMGALVAGLLHGKPGSLHKFLERPMAQLLGRLSFSLYLLNVPVLYVIWGHTAGRTWPASHALEAGLIVGAAATLITLPLAWVSERYVERGGILAGRALVRALGLSGQSIPKAKTAPTPKRWA